MIKVINLILKHKDKTSLENGNEFLETDRLEVLPRVGEHLIINNEMFRVVGIFHNLGFSVEILAVYDGTPIEVHKKLFG